jgi:hypothetical protein
MRADGLIRGAALVLRGEAAAVGDGRRLAPPRT